MISSTSIILVYTYTIQPVISIMYMATTSDLLTKAFRTISFAQKLINGGMPLNLKKTPHRVSASACVKQTLLSNRAPDLVGAKYKDSNPIVPE